MGAALIRAVQRNFLLDEYDSNHTLMKGDGEYTPTYYEKRLIDIIRGCSIAVLISFAWTLYIILWNGLDSRFEQYNLICAVAIFVQSISTYMHHNWNKARSYTSICGCRIITEFFLVIVVARYMTYLGIVSLSCQLNADAFDSSNEKPRSCHLSFTTTSLIANVLYSAPTLFQIHCLRQLQHSYQRRLEDDGAEIRDDLPSLMTVHGRRTASRSRSRHASRAAADASSSSSSSSASMPLWKGNESLLANEGSTHSSSSIEESSSSYQPPSSSSNSAYNSAV